MARNKNNLKKIEDFAERTGMMRPRSLSDDDIADIQRMIQNAGIESKANPNPETRSLSEIVSDIENDKNKSQARKDFELRIAGIADRIKDHLDDQPVPPLVRDYHNANQAPLQLVSETKKTDPDSDQPLSEMIRNLRKRLN